MTDKTSLSYKDAGVDIDADNALVDRIKGVVKQTKRPEVMGWLGGFGAMCALPQKYRKPILVSGTDELDGGPVVLQAWVPVFAGDDE